MNKSVLTIPVCAALTAWVYASADQVRPMLGSLTHEGIEVDEEGNVLGSTKTEKDRFTNSFPKTMVARIHLNIQFYWRV